MSQTLQFVGTDPYCRKSECGRYAISKIYIEGKARYEAVTKANGRKAWEFIAQNIGTYGEAARLCEAHAATAPQSKEKASA
ncbi:MAG: hypothetical protein KGL39_36230 [Patescibacteria group bacterium]|nr:hypothetical protein [Patescibacteria group bacterium]